MKKLVITTAIALAFGSTAALAHHPAADIVDPEIYAMIDENVSDTPHADLVLDDMGPDVSTDSGSADSMEAAAAAAWTPPARPRGRGVSSRPARGQGRRRWHPGASAGRGRVHKSRARNRGPCAGH